MLDIKKSSEDGKITYVLEGRLDTTTAPMLEDEISGIPQDTTELVFDFEDLEYISSAGLRVLLAAQKTMNEKGSMKVTNVNEIIMEIFEVTGFVDILDLEKE